MYSYVQPKQIYCKASAVWVRQIKCSSGHFTIIQSSKNTVFNTKFPPNSQQPIQSCADWWLFCVCVCDTSSSFKWTFQHDLKGLGQEGHMMTPEPAAPFVDDRTMICSLKLWKKLVSGPLSSFIYFTSSTMNQYTKTSQSMMNDVRSRCINLRAFQFYF